MNPLKYLVPRLGLLGVLILGIWVSAEWVTRRTISQTHVLEPFDVSVDQASIQWQDRTLLLRNLQLGVAGTPETFRADKVTLKLDDQALLEKRWVVVDGMLTNPSVGPSSSDGTRDASSGLAARLESALAGALKQSDGYHSRSRLTIEPTWLQQIQAATSRTANSGGHTLQALESLKQKWETQLAQCRQEILALQEQVIAAQTWVQQPVNPLRSDARLAATQRVNELNQQILELQGQIEQIYGKAHAELATVLETAEGEIRQLESALRLPVPPSEAIGFDFMAQQPRETVQQVFQWAEWAIGVVPNPEAKLPPQRGRDVSFGRTAVPSLEVQKLTIVGVTDVGGHYYRLMGSLNNLSNLPHTQRYPTRLSIRAQGQNHVIVSGLYDRRLGENKSYFSVKSLDLNQAEGVQLMAAAEDRVGLPVQLSPHAYAAQLNLNLDGEKVDGRLVIRHSGMQVDCNPNLLGDAVLAQRVRQQLQEIEDCEVAFRLTGTVDRIVATSQTDLGQKIASALSGSTHEYFAAKVNQQAAEVKSLVQTHQTTLSGWLESETRTLMAALRSEQEQVAGIQGRFPSGDGVRLR